MSETPHSDDLKIADYQALAEFRYRLRSFLAFSENVTRAAGLEPRQHQLLLAIKGFPGEGPVTVGELAERLNLRHHSTVELINRAEERGLVERHRAEADRRQVFIALTAHGEAVLRELTLYHRAELRTAGPALVQALTQIIAGGARPNGRTGEPLGQILEEAYEEAYKEIANGDEGDGRHTG